MSRIQWSRSIGFGDRDASVRAVVPKSIMEQGLYGVDQELSSNSVEVLVHRLRKKLADSHAQVEIHTVRGVGYMIMAESPQPRSRLKVADRS